MARIEYIFNGLETSVEFDFPAVREELRKIKPEQKTVTSLTGEQYTTHYVNIELLSQTFTHLSYSFVESVLRPFFRDHASLKREFKYFPNKSSSEFFVAKLEKPDFLPVPHPQVLDRYNITFQLRIIGETLPATNITDTTNTLIMDDNGQKSFILIDDNGEKFVATYEEIA